MKRLLIADDDPIYRDLAVETLSGCGFDITTAVDGLKAAAELAEKRFDIAIVDVNMPGLDGLQVIRNARMAGPNTQTPMIVITGQDEASAVTDAYESGATSFLTKPLNWLLFTPHIQFVLRAAETESELRQTNEMAGFLSKLKSQMMAALAQEFQSPIKSIFAFSELIRKEAFGPLVTKNYIEIAEQLGQASVQLNSSLLKMLSFGQSLSEQITLKEEHVPLTDLIDEAISAHELSASRRGINVKTLLSTPPDLCILGDRVLVSQAIRALVGNSVRFAPRGSEVQISTTVDAAGNLVIGASDNGPALSQEIIAQLKGADLSVAPTAYSPDLRDVGIAIAKVLIEAHQGHLQITTDSAAGTKASFSLPKNRISLGDTADNRIVPPSGSATAPVAAIQRLASRFTR